MLRRYKKISFTRTLWTSTLLTLLLSSLLGGWLLFESINTHSLAKKRMIQFNSIYKLTTSFNVLARERIYANQLVFSTMEDKQKYWDELQHHRDNVNKLLANIEQFSITPQHWAELRLSLKDARQGIDYYKDRLAINPNETKQAIYGMITATEVFRLIMAKSSVNLVKKDSPSAGSLLQLLTLSNIQDNIGRLASPILVSLYLNMPLSVEDIEALSRRLERLKGSWEVLNAIPDNIPEASRAIFKQKLSMTRQEFNQNGLELITTLKQNNDEFKSHYMTTYEFSQQYREGLEYVIDVQKYYLDELFKFHQYEENKAALKVIIISVTMFLITILVISLAVYIQKRLLQPLLLLNKLTTDMARGQLSLQDHDLSEMGELQYLYKAIDNLNYQIKEHQDITLRLTKESREDSLTGLANRRKFQLFAQELLKQAHSNFPVTIIIIDLDHFKKINDTWGHPFGDKILVSVAEILKSCSTENGLAARLGGEEFVMLLPCKSRDIKITELVHEIQSQINSTSFITDNNTPVSITASFGVSETTKNNLSILLSNADIALYKAKKAGRNCIRYHIDV